MYIGHLCSQPVTHALRPVIIYYTARANTYINVDQRKKTTEVQKDHPLLELLKCRYVIQYSSLVRHSY